MMYLQSTTDSYIYATWLETPLGKILAIADNHYLHVIDFFDGKNINKHIHKVEKKLKRPLSFEKNAILMQIEQELAEYFAGKNANFQTPLAPFQHGFVDDVLTALCAVPANKICAYRDIAKQIGREKANRAVAGAISRNPLAIIVPCHRVVGANGALTGYAGGLWRKKWLLDHENAHFC